VTTRCCIRSDSVPLFVLHVTCGLPIVGCHLSSTPWTRHPEPLKPLLRRVGTIAMPGVLARAPVAAVTGVMHRAALDVVAAVPQDNLQMVAVAVAAAMPLAHPAPPRQVVPLLRAGPVVGAAAAPKRQRTAVNKRAGLEELRRDAAQGQLARSSRVDTTSGSCRTWLEDHAVKPATLQDYGRRIETLRQYCRQAGLMMGTRALDETAFLEWADHAFAEGLSAQEGTKMLAAYTHFVPENGRFGQPLARVARALQAWGRIVPSLGRIPPAFPMVCGIVCSLKSMGHADMALAALVALSGYWWPGELHGLRGQDAVAPRPRCGEGCHLRHAVPSGDALTGLGQREIQRQGR
jgi:hypothetical protein